MPQKKTVNSRSCFQAGNHTGRPLSPFRLSRSGKLSVFLICLSFIPSLSYFCCSKNQSDSNQASGRRFGPGGFDGQSAAAIPVQAVPVKRGELSLFLMQTTTIEAERRVDILAKVSGQVVELPAEEGLEVKQGDLLVQLDEAELTIDYMRSKVSYETDKSVYERSKEMLENKFISTEDYLLFGTIPFLFYFVF